MVAVWDILLLVAFIGAGIGATGLALRSEEAAARRFTAARSAEMAVRQCSGRLAFERNVADAAEAAAGRLPEFASQYRAAAAAIAAQVGAEAGFLGENITFWRDEASCAATLPPESLERPPITGRTEEGNDDDENWTATLHWERNEDHPAPWPNSVVRFVAGAN